MEGAPSRAPAGETAFAHRGTPFVLNIHTRWQEAKDEGENRVRDAYTQEVWDRLVQLKNTYDPNNLFRMNQNIKPS